MKKTIILLITFFLILFVIIPISFYYYNSSLTGRVIQDTPELYTYTKAFCNSSNFCQDFIISCLDDRVLEIKATYNKIKFSEDWTDLRDNLTIRELCKR